MLATKHHKSRIINHVFLIRDFLLDLIFPISCIICQKGEKYLCDECKEKIIIKRGDDFSSYRDPCKTKDELDGLWISSDYQNKVLAILIKKLKYSFNKKLAPILGGLIIDFIKKNKLNKNNYLFNNLKNLIIIPVPLHKNKKKFRGFNQSELLAEIISKKFNLSMNTKNLIRHKNTKAQAKLNKKQRQVNVKNAFSWTGNNLKNKNIILVDDVSSTRSTLNNCAKVLKTNDAQVVWGLVLAKN